MVGDTVICKCLFRMAWIGFAKISRKSDTTRSAVPLIKLSILFYMLGCYKKIYACNVGISSDISVPGSKCSRIIAFFTVESEPFVLLKKCT